MSVKFFLFVSGLMVAHFFSVAQDSTHHGIQLKPSLIVGLKIFERVANPDQYNPAHYRVDPLIGFDLFSAKYKIGLSIKRDYFLGLYAQNPDFDLNGYEENSYLDLYKELRIGRRLQMNVGLSYVWQREESILFWSYQSSLKNYYPYRGIFPHVGVHAKWLDLDLGYYIEYHPDISIDITGIWFSTSYKIHLTQMH